MNNDSKYEQFHFMHPECSYEWVKKAYIEEAPMWCSVDLNDGNQDQAEQMSLENRLAVFKKLVDVGFKEIAVGSPAASEMEYCFLRTLIEQKMIPSDVNIQVLTEDTEYSIRKTFEGIKGLSHGTIHLYHSVSIAQSQLMFKKYKEQIKGNAIYGAKLIKQLAKETDCEFSFQYTPESFCNADIDDVAEVCNAVLDVWQPVVKHQAIVNISVNLEREMAHVVANKVEYISKKLKYRDVVMLRLHPYNDRGIAIAVAELGILAGAQGIEGIVFGNSGHKGLLDLVSLSKKLHAQGIDSKLDFSNLQQFFTSLHQNGDDIVLDTSKDHNTNAIHSHSFKDNVACVLKENFGVSLPKEMLEDVKYTIKTVSERKDIQLTPQLAYEIFENKYINKMPYFKIVECHFKQMDGIMAETFILHAGKTIAVHANGNGRLDAVSNALKQYFGIHYELVFFEEHALSQGSTSKAMAYVGIVSDGKTLWGVGTDDDIITSSIHALCVAVNQIEGIKDDIDGADGRLIEIMNYIQLHYLSVTLEELALKFHLSEPYLSKYIKEKSGKTFGEILQGIRMNRAKSLLKNSSMTVENIAYAVGYQNVEHFDRIFKKRFEMTPIQYRNSKKI